MHACWGTACEILGERLFSYGVIPLSARGKSLWHPPIGLTMSSSLWYLSLPCEMDCPCSSLLRRVVPPLSAPLALTSGLACERAQQRAASAQADAFGKQGGAATAARGHASQAARESQSGKDTWIDNGIVGKCFLLSSLILYWSRPCNPIPQVHVEGDADPNRVLKGTSAQMQRVQARREQGLETKQSGFVLKINTRVAVPSWRAGL